MVLLASLSKSFQVISGMNLAFGLVLGFAVKRPLTLVMLIKSDLSRCASLAAVVSEVAFGVNLRAPQITIWFFLKAERTCFMSVGNDWFALEPKSCMRK